MAPGRQLRTAARRRRRQGRAGVDGEGHGPVAGHVQRAQGLHRERLHAMTPTLESPLRIPLLLLGSLLLVTPACDPGVEDWVTVSTEVEAVALTATEPHFERRLRVEARARPDTGAKMSRVDVSI